MSGEDVDGAVRLFAWIVVLAAACWSGTGLAGAAAPGTGGVRLAQETVAPPRMMIPEAATVATVRVPELRKRPVKDAAAVLSRVGLRLGEVTPVISSAAQGTVLRQSPGAGKAVKPGSRVDVWVAKALSNTVKVPSLIGRHLRDVRTILLKSRLRLDRATAIASDSPEGTVLRQSPGAGQGVEQGAPVNVWFAQGPPAAPPEVQVPNLLRRHVIEARKILAGSDLQLGSATSIPSDLPAGTVLRQSPGAGRTVKRGSSVDVWVAREAPAAPSTVRVPDLLRRDVDEAREILAKSRLRLGRATTLRSDAPEGTVLRQSPGAGHSAEVGSRVDVWLAQGPPAAPSAVTVPDLVRRHVDEARQILSKSNLQLGRATSLASDAPEGTVLRQSPGAGESVSPGSRVDVWLAQGPPAPPPGVTVPDLVGRDVREARDLLLSAELRLGRTLTQPSEEPEGTVLRQSPAAGQRAEPGSRVDIWLARTVAVKVPDLAGLPVAEAEKRLRGGRLSLGAQTQRASLPPAGRVLAQKPSAGTEVKAGTAVDLAVGDGSQVHVPSLIGESEDSALARLEAAGLRTGPRRTEESERAAGRILRQQPNAGSVVDRGSAVAYWVSRARQVVVPSVVGLRTGEARDRLARLGLKAEQAGAEESERPREEILRQQPAPGAQVARGTPVRFWVAAPALVVVPDLSGLRTRDARDRLAALGLVMVARAPQQSGAPKDTVVGQDPAPATAVTRATPVVVRVSAGRSLLQPWIIGGGGAALLAAGAGLWAARRRLRAAKGHGSPAGPTVRVTMKPPDPFVVDTLPPAPGVPTIQLRAHLVEGGSKVIADKLVVREERRNS